MRGSGVRGTGSTGIAGVGICPAGADTCVGENSGRRDESLLPEAVGLDVLLDEPSREEGMAPPLMGEDRPVRLCTDMRDAVSPGTWSDWCSR